MYKVFWTELAELQLGELCADYFADGLPAITSAADNIDHSLKTDPYGESESRVGPERILIRLPLGVHLRILDSIRTVVVTGVWHIDKKPRTRN